MFSSKKVFIDTECFVKAGLHFKGSSFLAFKGYCQAGKIFHVTTSVVIREVYEQIKTAVSEGLNALNTFRRKARILSSVSNGEIQALFKSISEDCVYRNAKETFISYLEDCDTEVIDAKNICSEELLSMYFKSMPPFSNGKKKAEFPDAISLLALKSGLIDENDRIYIVSGDSDIKDYCKNINQFVYVESLEKLLDIVSQIDDSKVRDPSEIVVQVKEFIASNNSYIVKEICKQVESSQITNDSGWEDSKIDGGIEITGVGEIDPKVIGLDEQLCLVNFDLDLELSFIVTGPVSNLSIRAMREMYNQIIGMHSFEVTKNMSFTVELAISYSISNDETYFEVTHLEVINIQNGISVNIKEPIK